MKVSIESVSDLLSHVYEVQRNWNTQVWWRGQSSAGYLLVPGVYRINQGVRTEQNLVLRFRQFAATRYNKCPQQDDYCSWLFLAQHYGLPTRLLDWSESPLVALYFAVTGNTELDASIFAMQPHEMNRIVNNDHTLVAASSAPAKTLFTGAFYDQVQENINIAILSHELDSRMLAQQSVFTLHGSSDDLSESQEIKDVIRTFNIPASSKSSIIQELASLGIRRRTLFPDLDNLASDLRQLVFSDVGILTD